MTSIVSLNDYKVTHFLDMYKILPKKPDEKLIFSCTLKEFLDKLIEMNKKGDELPSLYPDIPGHNRAEARNVFDAINVILFYGGVPRYLDSFANEKLAEHQRFEKEIENL